VSDLAIPQTLLHPLKATVVGFHEEENEYSFQVEYPDPEVCPNCGTCGEVVRFGKKQVKFRDLPLHGRWVTLWLVRRRFMCRACNTTFSPALPEMAESNRMTRRLADYIIKATVGRTNSDVGREVGVNESVIRTLFRDHFEAQKDRYKPTAPRVLGIDELYLQRTYRCVLTNIEEETIIDLLESRTKPQVTAYLSRLKDRKDIEIVCMDMWNPYREVTKALMPQATIVVDKFHIQRMANEAMEKIRKSLKAGLSQHRRRALKGDRKLMLMREHDLNPMNRMVVDTWLNQFPELGAAYRLKEEFLNIWNLENESDAKEEYRRWHSSLTPEERPQWAPLTTAMSNWEAEIFAYFGNGQRNTNAFTESMNRQMKDLNRLTRSMSFEMFRAKILFSVEHKMKRKEKPRRESPFTMGYGLPTDANLAGRAPSMRDMGAPIRPLLEFLLEPPININPMPSAEG
jgi:transposase